MSYEAEMWKPWEQQVYERAMKLNNERAGRGLGDMKGDVLFGARKVTSSDEQVVVYVKHEGSENSKELCRLLPKSQHYNRGLEKNFKPLVNVVEIAENIVTLLQAHHDIERLTSVTYGNIVEAYDPFVDRWLKYGKVLDFINKSEGDDWI